MREIKEDKYERFVDIGDRGRGVVFRPGMAVAPIGRLDLNAPGLPGRGRKREIKRREELTGSP